jgi:hypothetical protein
VPEALIDSRLLEKLERLTIHWQKSLPGLVGGHNTSRFAGAGVGILVSELFSASAIGFRRTKTLGQYQWGGTSLSACGTCPTLVSLFLLLL